MNERIQILDSVYKELSVVLTEFEEELHKIPTDKKKEFWCDKECKQ